MNKRFLALCVALCLPLTCLGQAFSFRDLPYMAPRGGEPLLGGLLAVWSFDEQIASGTRVNSLGATLPLYDQANNIPAMAGAMQGAADFSGAGKALTNLDLGLGSGSFTFAAWIIDPNGNGSFMGQTTDNLSAKDYNFNGDGDYQMNNTAGATAVIHGIVPGNVLSNWTFCVFGYDLANSRIFAYSNNGPILTASLAGTRTNGTPFNLKFVSGAVDELMLWNRVLTSAEVTRLYNSGFGLKYPFSAATTISGQIASNYLWSCTYNGGVTPSTNTLSAVDAFASGLISDGLWDATRYILTFDPAAVTNALTPIKFQTVPDGNGNTVAGGNPAINNSGKFVATDLSITGLKGDASTKSLVLGRTIPLNPSQFTPSSFAFALATTIVTASGVDFGGLGGSTQGANLASKFTDNTTDAKDGDSGNNVIVATSPGAGFYLDSRVNNTDHRLYYATPASAWAQIGTTDTTARSVDWNLGYQFPFYVFAQNINGAIGSYTSDSISFLALFNRGLSSAEGSAFYNRVQTLFASRGGGYPNLITTQPTNSAVLFGNNRTFVMAASGSPSAYQWQKNGVNIAGATQSSYTVTSAALSDSGSYTCTATIGGLPYTTLPAQLSPVTTTTVSNWVNQCYIAGATALSSNTTWAVDQFWNGCVTDGNDSNILVCNTYAPDNLIAAITPLVAGGGNNSWVNQGSAFVSADLTVNGLKGNASNKSLNTGFLQTSFTANNSGIAYYYYSTNTVNAEDGGAQSFPNGYFLTMADTTATVMGYNQTAGQGSITATITSATPGWVSAQRTSSTSQDIYFYNSGTAHTSLAHTATSGGSLVALNMWVFVLNNANSAFGYSDCRMSFLAYTKGLDSTHDANLASRAQSLRVAYGGGYH